MAALGLIAYLELCPKPIAPGLIPADDLIAAMSNPHGNITPEVFRVPTTQPEKWNFGGDTTTALNWSNWNATPGSQKTMGYTYQNPFGKSSRGATGEVQSDK